MDIPTTDDPIAVVCRFVAAWDGFDVATIATLLSPDVIFENGPLPTIMGCDAVLAYLSSAGPFDACRWEIVSIAATGGTVLTERIDHLVVRGCAITLPIMGRFDVVYGRITVWRDYFDLTSYRAQWPAPMSSRSKPRA